MTPWTNLLTSPLDDNPLWYRDAIIYQLHVKAFYDYANDGIGDFRGLAHKLDYLADLGVTALWLLPFFPSPLKDDGYDVSDYFSIHPHYGSLRDFKFFLKKAHKLGLRVIIDFVINHTSDQHPWFQSARTAPPGSAERDFYIWSDSDKKFADTRIIFCDVETSNWAWDPVAQAYYWHRFYSHQPDLNLNNPRVVEEVIKVLRFWLDMGIDGLRLDAVPYLCVREGTSNENLLETHAVIKQIRREVDSAYKNRILIAEANHMPEAVRAYFGDGDECHMAFHFPLMPRLFIALRRGDREPIVDVLSRTPTIPETCQWAIFLRNHDELTLEMVTGEERDYMWNQYAVHPQMRFNLGIRRRLAPLVDNNQRCLEVLNSLLFSLPGTPVIYYGDEIGMGDNIYLGDRNGVRTPMQWSIDRNAGFSRCDPAQLYLPLNMDPIFSYQRVNVEVQQRELSSLWHFMKRLVTLKKQNPVLGRGGLQMLYPANRTIFAYLRILETDLMLCVVNLSPYPQVAELDLTRYQGQVPIEMFSQTAFPVIQTIPYLFMLGPYSFYWFQLKPNETK